MKTTDILTMILNELYETRARLKQAELTALEDQIRKANRIFVAGAGRSLLMIRGFAMRLMHAGFTVYVVGDTITPAIETGDLLLIASGSGETGTLKSIAMKCKKIGADLGLITTNPGSTLAQLADFIVEVAAGTTKRQDNQAASVQPGANTFEQCILLIGDALVIRLMSAQSLDKNNAELMKRHANLE